MILYGYSILDMRTGAYALPFFVAHVAHAIRACVDLGRDTTTVVGRYPGDFSLCAIGTFDDATGVFMPTGPDVLGTVVGFLPQPSSVKEAE